MFSQEYEELSLQHLDKSLQLEEPTAIALTLQVAQVYATLAVSAATHEGGLRDEPA